MNRNTCGLRFSLVLSHLGVQNEYFIITVYKSGVALELSQMQVSRSLNSQMSEAKEKSEEGTLLVKKHIQYFNRILNVLRGTHGEQQVNLNFSCCEI